MRTQYEQKKVKAMCASKHSSNHPVLDQIAICVMSISLTLIVTNLCRGQLPWGNSWNWSQNPVLNVSSALGADLVFSQVCIFPVVYLLELRLFRQVTSSGWKTLLRSLPPLINALMVSALAFVAAPFLQLELAALVVPVLWNWNGYSMEQLAYVLPTYLQSRLDLFRLALVLCTLPSAACGLLTVFVRARQPGTIYGDIDGEPGNDALTF